MVIERLNRRKYNIPKNISKTSEHKYVEVINKGYAKYIHAIALSGGFCMYKQFGRLIDIFNENKKLSSGTIEVYTSTILKELEELGFIGTDFLNRNKYIYLRHPSLALVEGDYNTSKRINLKKELKIHRFSSAITKMEYLLENDHYFSQDTLNLQLVGITKEILKLINESGNIYKHDTTTIRRIIELGRYNDIKYILNNTRENTTRLGVVRFVWEEIGKEYWKLGLQGQTIHDVPLYFKLNLQNNGSITLHYAPIIILIDNSRDLQYYNTQSNKYFNMFFNMKGNATQRLKSEFISSNRLGYEHFNRVGYTVKVIGSSSSKLKDKVDVLNEPYYRDNDVNEHTPLIYPCEYQIVDTDDYFLQGRNLTSSNKVFLKVDNNINKLINMEKEREGIR